MPIPAGDPSVTVQYTDDVGGSMSFVRSERVGITLDQPFALHSVYMHQHVLGKFNSLDLVRKDGTEIRLIDIRDWDFDWQDEYTFEDEVIVQPGDEFRLTCNWDNSASNQQFVNGKQMAPQYVEFGEGTVDEMCVTYFYVTRIRDEDRGKLQDLPPTVAFHLPGHLQVFHPGDYVPVELLVNAFALQEPGGSHTEEAPAAVADSADGAVHAHRAGHFHLYLDNEDASAESLEAFEPAIYYRLPENLQPGQHTLRVSLQNDEHEPIGVEDRVAFIVEPVAAIGTKPLVASLINAADWQTQSAAADTFAAHRPDSVSCPENAWHEEDGALEVETGYCNYLSLTQPSKAAINKGDNMHLVLWHGQLRFEQPAKAHVAVSIGGKRVWEDQIEIPNAAGIYDIVIPSTISASAGASVEYHLHNHGYNTWTLLTLEVQR